MSQAEVVFAVAGYYTEPLVGLALALCFGYVAGSRSLTWDRSVLLAAALTAETWALLGLRDLLWDGNRWCGAHLATVALLGSP